jgi:hypothetical protein
MPDFIGRFLISLSSYADEVSIVVNC